MDWSGVRSKRVGSRWVLVALVGLLGGCATIPVDKRADLRAEINTRADETIAALVEKDPDVQELLDESEGYLVGRLTGFKIIVLGGATGLGVLYDKAQDSRTYLNLDRFDLGIGVGANRQRVLAIFNQREALEGVKRGGWKPSLGAESSAGSSGGAASTDVQGVDLYYLSESGAIISTTARLARMSVNTDLTDTGVSPVGIPNIGYRPDDLQGEDAPRIWGRKLPFLAQKVIDLGYDLPLPYGVGLTYANVDQDMILENLWVGINGRDEEPFEFVAFEDASAESESYQLKLDAWVLPFMNVFGMLGKVEGNAPMDILLDGNLMLEHLEVDCPPLPPKPLCGLLQDSVFVLPIDASFSGNTYGLGTVLAGGWNGWFFALPLSFNYADMATTETNGFTITATPRGGRLINMNRWGTLALFTGGNWLKAELTVSGQVSTPDELVVIDYTIDQRNTDGWNLVLGANWDISKRWSWSAEYNGFIGSREAFITSLTWRW